MKAEQIVAEATAQIMKWQAVLEAARLLQGPRRGRPPKAALNGKRGPGRPRKEE